jgi:hypothetical protein
MMFPRVERVTRWVVIELLARHDITQRSYQSVFCRPGETGGAFLLSGHL